MSDSKITPAFNKLVENRAIEIATANKWFSKKGFDKAFNMAIKESGYTVPYYNSIMRQFERNIKMKGSTIKSN